MPRRATPSIQKGLSTGSSSNFHTPSTPYSTATTTLHSIPSSHLLAHSIQCHSCAPSTVVAPHHHHHGPLYPLRCCHSEPSCHSWKTSFTSIASIPMILLCILFLFSFFCVFLITAQDLNSSFPLVARGGMVRCGAARRQTLFHVERLVTMLQPVILLKRVNNDNFHVLAPLWPAAPSVAQLSLSGRLSPMSM